MARILIVDDNKTSALSMLQEALCDHDLTTAPCGEKALAMIKKGQEFDLVIASRFMPKIKKSPKKGGIWILHELRRNKDNTPVIILSHDVVGDAASGYKAAGFAAALNKCFTPEKAMEAVKQASDGKT